MADGSYWRVGNIPLADDQDAGAAMRPARASTVLLAHIFEEISVTVLHHLIPEALLFDAFGFDLYWDELREDIMSLRRQTGNDKFCENFEIASDRARDYRSDRPPKGRWGRKPEGDDPPRRPAVWSPTTLRRPPRCRPTSLRGEGPKPFPPPSGGRLGRG